MDSEISGYDYLVEYKKGADNRVVDVLSRCMADQDMDLTNKGLTVVIPR